MSAFDKWDVVRILLGLGLVFCNVGVWRGVALEYSTDEWTKETGKRLLVRSLAFEAFLAFTLLAVDTAVSLRDRAEVAAAETVASDARTRAANAELELAKLQRPRKMTNAQMQKFVATLRLYPGRSFWVMVQKSGSSKFGEQIDFGRQLSEAFTLANWKRTNHSEKDETKESPEFTDVADRGCSAAAETLPLANIVSDALKEVEIHCVATEDPSLISNLVFIEIGLQ
jgi:hypothetical protein